MSTLTLGRIAAHLRSITALALIVSLVAASGVGFAAGTRADSSERAGAAELVATGPAFGTITMAPDRRSTDTPRENKTVVAGNHGALSGESLVLHAATSWTVRHASRPEFSSVVSRAPPLG